MALLETIEIGGLKTSLAKGEINSSGDATHKAEAAKSSTSAEIGFKFHIVPLVRNKPGLKERRPRRPRRWGFRPGWPIDFG